MNEPSRTLIAGAALAALLTETTDVPGLEPLHGSDVYWRLHRGKLAASFYTIPGAGGVLAAAEQYFGGTAKLGSSNGLDTVERLLCTEWHGIPLEVSVPVPKVDEVAELRKRIAELEAAAAVDAQVSA